MADVVDKAPRDAIAPTLQVLVLGLPRTSTTSLRYALKELGYPHGYHWDSMCLSKGHSEWWLDLMKRKFEYGSDIQNSDFERVFQGWTNIADWPASFFSEDLIRAYPNAKVILTVRDNSEVWHRSVMNTLWRYQQPKNLPQGLWQHVWYYSLPRTVYNDIYKIIFTKTPFGNFPLHGVQWYTDHIQMIRDLVPRERLLEMNAKDGWEPLCEFLGKAIPSTPYPRVNDGESFRAHVDGVWEKWRVQKTLTFSNWLTVALLGIGGVFGILYTLT